MLAAQSPLSGNQLIQRPKSNRKPLQPKNSAATTPTSKVNPKNWAEISESNKENAPHPIFNYCSSPLIKEESFPIESLDASLADELSAIREKLERLRIDKDETEKMLRDRAIVLDSQMKEILQRGEVQKMLEIEVDRLYRLKEIRLAACLRVSPLRSLRDKEQEKKKKKKMKQPHLLLLQEVNDKGKNIDEAKDESESQSPSSVVDDTDK